MIVPGLEYHLENRLVAKLDIMIDRCTDPKKRRDAVLIIEGSEGEGKTNSSEAISYYIKQKTSRDIHMFFRLNTLIEFAKKTEGKIIIWDEPALDSLSADARKEINQNLIRLLMTCRKKRHFFIFNFVKFYKFNEYIVVDRALGLIHMYSRDGIQSGRFVYIRQKFLQNLYTDYKVKKRREYKKYMAFGGSFPMVEDLLGRMGITIEGIPNCNLDMYEKLKDKAIDSIGTPEKQDKNKGKLQELKKTLGLLKFPINTKQEFADLIGIDRKTLLSWGKQGGGVDIGEVEGQINL